MTDPQAAPRTRYRRIVIWCVGGKRHRWAWVDGAMSEPGHFYVERACQVCHIYESEIR